MSDNLAQLFHERFLGLERAHGVYEVARDWTKGKKRKGQARTVAEPVTDELWAMHLAGTKGIGIVPIRDDGTCGWGCIDIDIYKDLDFEAVEAKVKEIKAPLVLCKTKSGGIHAFLFCSRPAPAALVRARLGGWAAQLGFKGSEIFPKQDRLGSAQDFGNWLNMPYFGETRLCFLDGSPLSAGAFLEYAITKAIDPDDLANLEEGDPDDLLFGAPPCLRAIAASGIPEGRRNDLLFQFSVYCAKRFPDDEAAQRRHLLKINKEICDKPMATREINQTIAKGMKKGYQYACTKILKPHCNRDVCRQVEFGVGEMEADAGIDLADLEQYGERGGVYHLTVNGKRVRFDGIEDVLDQNKFIMVCAEATGLLPVRMKRGDWDAIIRPLFAERTVVETIEDVNDEALIWKHIEDFCSGNSVGKHEDDLLLGRAFDDGEHIYFDFLEILKHLDQARFPQIHKKRVRLAQIITEHQGQKETRVVKGQPINVFRVPKTSISRQEEQNDDRIAPPAF